LTKQKKNYKIVNYKRFVASMIVLGVITSVSVESIITKVTVKPVQVIENAEVINKPIAEVEPQVVQETTPETVRVEQTTISRSSNQHSEDVRLLAKVIMGEAESETYSGKLAVGTVVVNRMNNNNTARYGGPTIKGVIYKKGQFNCVDEHDWNSLQPNEDSIKAAEQVFEGYRSFRSDILYYFNPKTAGDRTFMNNVNVIVTIGRHQFGTAKK
jgi:N-acetylmuramoyl-L-alanine amidase